MIRNYVQQVTERYPILSLIGQNAWVLLLLALLALFAPALHAKALPAVPQFSHLSVPLNDGWQCAPDVNGQAPRETWSQGLPAPETVSLPLNWDHHPLYRNPGVAEWYARTVTFPSEAGSAGALLVLNDPVGSCEVFLDGKQVAVLFGNGLTRRIELPGEPGSTHFLALRLDRSALPAAMRDAVSCGLGQVSLQALPPVRIAKCLPLLDLGDKSLAVRYRLVSDAQRSCTLHVELFAPNASQPLLRQALPMTLAPGALEGERRFKVKGLVPWSPASPQSYFLRVTLAGTDGTGDTCEQTCGAMQCEFKGSTLLVNGKPTLIKGLRLPGGVPPLNHKTLQEALETELSFARQAGFNAIMSDGAALPTELYDIADRLGLLVFSDVPLGSVRDADGNEVITPDFQSAVDELGGHPCLAAWSFADLASTERTAALLRAQDPTRPVLWRNGAHSLYFPPASANGKPFCNIDFTLHAQTPAPTWSTNGLPLLAGCIKVPLDLAAIQAQGREAWDADALTAVREMVEQLRGTDGVLGYFVCPLRNGTLTGLTTPARVPTRAFTSAVVYNQQCLVTLEVDASAATPKLQAAVINDQSWAGSYNLYQVLISPEGTTSITQKEIVLKGDRVQNLLDMATVPETPGHYRMQLLLAKESKVIASTQVVTLDIPNR